MEEQRICESFSLSKLGNCHSPLRQRLGHIIVEATFDITSIQNAGGAGTGPFFQVQCWVDNVLQETLNRLLIKRVVEAFERECATPIQAQLKALSQLDSGRKFFVALMASLVLIIPSSTSQYI
jgi:hypothetical protein